MMARASRIGASSGSRPLLRPGRFREFLQLWVWVLGGFSLVAFLVSTANAHPTSEPPSSPALSHSIAASTIRSRQYNPLRAARLYAVISVTQSIAVDALPPSSTAPTQWAIADEAGVVTLDWFLPQESATRSIALVMASRPPSITLPPSSSTTARLAVAAVIERSLLDHGDARRRPLTKPAPVPGVWIRTPPLMAEQPTEPQSPSWRPWCAGTEALMPPPPPEHGSEHWRRDMEEVWRVSSTLTDEQKAAAERWNLDVGSVTPPGVWNMLAREHLEQHPRPPAEHYRVLALLNMAMHDALVAGWRVKLKYWTERPFTAIRREFDPSFNPLLPTPPFPGYVSGHSVASGAAAEMLARLLPEAADRWRALAKEASNSRLWGGIHPRIDNEEGLRLGERVAHACLDRFEPTASKARIPLITVPRDMPPYLDALPRTSVWREPAQASKR
jgi:hypothetical protein